MTEASSSSESLPESEVRARHESNRAGWNEGALLYATQIEETAAFIRQGKSNLHPVERRSLGDLGSWCQSAIHLQCASGRDTLSLLNEGVQRVVGVDISDVHIDNARKTCQILAQTGHPVQAEWVRCDVLDTPHQLDGTADLVYTGRGALCWIQDIQRYAAVAARLLKPGGVYHVFDDHPVTILFDQDSDTYVFSGISYFGHWEINKGWPETYIGDALGIPTEQQSDKYERVWTLMEITNALIGAGLTIETLGEHPDPFWEYFPNLKPELIGLIPMTFSIRARKK